MGLPNAHRAFVEREKIVAYLLNATHPDNGGKAPFFRSLGFDANDWSRFAAALRRLALTGVVSRRLDSTHGTKYVIDGRRLWRERAFGPHGLDCRARPGCPSVGDGISAR
jgi:hypothetical protein